MKLYRGIKASEFVRFNKSMRRESNLLWKSILDLRASGNFSYPEKLNAQIAKLRDAQRTHIQNFSDNRQIATNYAKQNRGILIEIDVSVEDVLEHFTVEFQNFASRRKRFELVYTVPNEILTKFAKKWKLKEARP